MLAWNHKPIGDNLPAAYRWLAGEPAPKILIEMLKLYGVKETPGAANNDTIIGWGKELGAKAGMEYTADSTPWCGLAMGVCALRAGYLPPDICVRASAWDTFGSRVDGYPLLGDILRFERDGGGHVGLYVGEDSAGFLHVLGANQSDSVNVMRMSRSRLKTVRRSPWKIGQPPNVRRVFLAPTGSISENEA